MCHFQIDLCPYSAISGYFIQSNGYISSGNGINDDLDNKMDVGDMLLFKTAILLKVH